MNGGTMAGGPAGQLLTVDLSEPACAFSPLPQDGRRYLGGRGFNVWYLSRHLSRPVDPLSRHNILLISCGLLTGSSAPASSRVHINALSPLTGILGSSNIGGGMGLWLRSCNTAAIALTGAAKDYVYLHIDGRGARLKSAQGLWGMDTVETQDTLRRIHQGKPIKILTIGPAGERGVRFSAVISGQDHAAGRTGMGAVMGAKKLKAIVVEKGPHRYFKAAAPGQRQAVKSYAAKIKAADDFPFLSAFGSAGYVHWAHDFGIMGVKNYSGTGWDTMEKLDPRQLKKNIVKKSGCTRCPVQCKADIALGPDRERRFTRPEFEPMINLGPKCGLDNPDDIVRLDNLCTRLGMDSTSASGVIAFAMALYENKKLPPILLTGPDANPSQDRPLDLTWGNARAMEQLIFQMVENKGLGRLLRLGVKAAARRLGKDARDHAAHVKGLELTAYHPAAIMGTALGYAVSSRGGDYNNVYASLEYSWTRQEAIAEFGTAAAVDIQSTSAKGAVIKKAVTANIILDTLGLCKVPALSLLRSFNLGAEATLVRELTGMKIYPKDLAALGSEIAAMERRFNLRHSARGGRDILPDMFLGNGPLKIPPKDVADMVAQFYRAMGWDENGVPKQ